MWPFPHLHNHQPYFDLHIFPYDSKIGCKIPQVIWFVEWLLLSAEYCPFCTNDHFIKKIGRMNWCWQFSLIQRMNVVICSANTMTQWDVWPIKMSSMTFQWNWHDSNSSTRTFRMNEKFLMFTFAVMLKESSLRQMDVGV